MRVTPKIIDKPADTRNSDEAPASPFRSWMRREERVTPSVGGPHLLDLFVARQRVLAVDEAPALHVALAVLQADLADIGAHGRLMIERSIGDRTERRAKLQARHRRHQLVLVERAGLLDR